MEVATALQFQTLQIDAEMEEFQVSQSQEESVTAIAPVVLTEKRELQELHR